MDTLDLENTSLIDTSLQPSIFGGKLLDDLSKIDPNESREVLQKLSKAEVKISKLTAACKARDSEIQKLEKLNNDMKNLLKNSDIEDLNLQLQHLTILNKALEQKFQEGQIKIYNLEKSEKREIKELKFQVEELEKDKKYFEENLNTYRDQATMAEYEKSYLQSRNLMLEKRIKQLESEKEKEGFVEISPKKIVREKSTPELSQKSSLSSALKLFSEFPLGRAGSNNT
jgi:chromosome segregation ATPase